VILQAGDNDTIMGTVSERYPDWQPKSQVGRQRSQGLLERQSLYRMEAGTYEVQQKAPLERSSLCPGKLDVDSQGCRSN